MGLWDWLLGRKPKKSRERPGGTAKVYVIVGQRGSGKTTYAINLAKRLNKSVLVYTYTSDREAYKNYIRVSPEKVGKVTDEKGLYIINDIHFRKTDSTRKITITRVLTWIYNKFWHGTLLIDDAGGLLDRYQNQMIENILMDARHKNTDIILIFHSFSKIPLYVFTYMNWLIIFKTTGPIDKDRAKNLNEYEKIIEAQNEVNRSDDKHDYEEIEIA